MKLSELKMNGDQDFAAAFNRLFAQGATEARNPTTDQARNPRTPLNEWFDTISKVPVEVQVSARHCEVVYCYE